MDGYAELGAASAFSFLRGASRPEEMVETAAALGLHSIGIADHNTMAGVVRAHASARALKHEGATVRLAIGTRLVFADEHPALLAYPEDRAAYGRLCRLLTKGNLRSGVKGSCHLVGTDVLEDIEGVLFALVPPVGMPDRRHGEALGVLAEVAPGRVWLGVRRSFGPVDARALEVLARMGQRFGVPLLATADALYHVPERAGLHDVMTCIREHVTLSEAGRLLQPHAERHLKSPATMAALFAAYPEAVAQTIAFAERCGFSLDELRYEYPDEPVPAGKTPQQHLIDETWAGAAKRYPGGVPDKVKAALKHELTLIEQLDYAPYFLTVHDVVAYARGRGILCQGRGSAANSAVCYCLGITAVDPTEIDLLFARFVSSERKEPPDIDVDFEHERREEVIQYLYQRYGRHRAAIAGTVICYRPRSAIREVGKVFGLSEDVTAALANTAWGGWGTGYTNEQVRQAGLDPNNALIGQAVAYAHALIGFPRHLSQHVGGFVLTRGRLDETVPIGPAAMDDRTFIEWDKDDIDTLGIMKVDVLALGMLTCIAKGFALIRRHGGPNLSLARVPREDKAVYDMLSTGDSIGVFQVESRAQINMLPRLKPAEFYDLVIEVAIVRPGPIQGDMVHPYLRRRQGKEKVDFPSPSPKHGPPDELERVLKKTLGVPLFQEQAMRIAIEAAHFTPEEANGLRRAMATFRNVGTIDRYREKLVGGMVARGYEQAFAERCFKQIEGFGSYGFPESHAASFAHLVYVSSWMKRHHPAAFCCALLNSQPMGFYAPAQLVRDARDHGVEVRPVCINESDWDCTLEATASGLAVRLGFRQIDSFRQEWGEAIMAERHNAFPSLEALTRRTGLPRHGLEMLAEADALGSVGLSRRQGLWAVKGLASVKPVPLFAHDEEAETGPQLALPLMPLSQEVVVDYQTTRLSLKAHPMAFLREDYGRKRVSSCAAVSGGRDGQRLIGAGVVLVRQRPGSAKGVVFMTLEDETGVANVVIWPKTMLRFRKEVMGARLIAVHGRVQRSPEGITHLVAEKLEDWSADLARLSEDPANPTLRTTLARADEIARPVDPRKGATAGRTHPRNVRVLPASRDFH